MPRWGKAIDQLGGQRSTERDVSRYLQHVIVAAVACPANSGLDRSVVDQVAHQFESPGCRRAARADGTVIGECSGSQGQGSQTRNSSRSGIGEVGVIGDDV